MHAQHFIICSFVVFKEFFMDRKSGLYAAILGHPRIFLTLLSALFFIPLLGSYPVLGQWEPHYGRVAMEMMANGSWDWFLDPVYLGKHNFWSKPIFCFWMVFPFMKIFGPTELALRLPFAINGIFFVLLIHFIAEKILKDPLKALVAAFIAVFTPYTYMITRQFMWDITFVTFLTGSIGFLYIGQRDKDKKLIRLSYLFMGLGMLTKGLLAICFPIAAMILWMIATLDYSKGFKAVAKEAVDFVFSLRPFEGLAIFLVVSLPWYIYMGLKHGEPFYKEFFMEHHFGRLEGTIDKPDGPFEFYIWQLSLGAFPWVAFLIPALFSAAGKVRKNKDLAFALLTFFFLFLFFTLAATKFPHYVFPVVPFMVMILAEGFVDLLRSERFSKVYTVIGVVSALFLILIGKDIGTDFNYADMIYLITTHHVQTWFGRVFDLVPALTVFVPLMALFIILPAVKPDKKILFKISAAAFTLVAVVWSGYINFVWVPDMLEVFTPKHLVEKYFEMKKPGDKIVDFDNWKNRSMYFYLGLDEQLLRYTKVEQIQQLLERNPKATVFITTKKDKVSELRAALLDKPGIPITKIADDAVDTYMEIEMFTASLQDKNADMSDKWKKNLLEESQIPSGIKRINGTLGGKTVEIIGYEINKQRFDPGEEIELTLYYKVLKEMDKNWKVFFHFDVYSGALPHSFKLDDYPQQGYLPTTKWTPGMILKDTFKVAVPKAHPGGGVKIYTGFYEGNTRMEVDRESFNDGQKRFILGTFNVNIK